MMLYVLCNGRAPLISEGELSEDVSFSSFIREMCITRSMTERRVTRRGAFEKLLQVSNLNSTLLEDSERGTESRSDLCDDMPRVLTFS